MPMSGCRSSASACVPLINEPPAYTKINPRPTEAQWHEDEQHRLRLARALQAQDYRDISLGYFHGRLEASLTNTRISSMPRAVGRAARTMLSFAPLQTREIRITYKHGTLPVATYSFIHVPLLAALLQRHGFARGARALRGDRVRAARRGKRGEGPRRDARGVRGAAARGAGGRAPRRGPHRAARRERRRRALPHLARVLELLQRSERRLQVRPLGASPPTSVRSAACASCRPPPSSRSSRT